MRRTGQTPRDPTVKFRFPKGRIRAITLVLSLVGGSLAALALVVGLSKRNVDRHIPTVTPDSPVSVERLVLEPGRMRIVLRSIAPSPWTTKTVSFKAPLSYPLDLTASAFAPRPPAPGARVVVSANDAGKALVDRLAGLSRVLDRAPGYDALSRLERQFRGRPPAEARVALDGLLAGGEFGDILATVRDHAGTLLARELDIRTRERILDVVYRLEDFGTRLASFRLPVAVDLRNTYPELWRPGCSRSVPVGDIHPVRWHDAIDGAAGAETPNRHRWEHGHGGMHRFLNVAALTVLSGRAIAHAALPTWAKSRLQGTVVVPRGTRRRTAWVCCSTVSRTSALVLRVRLGGRVTLRLSQSTCPAAQSPHEVAHLIHTFNPSILEPGENEVVVEAGTCLDILRGIEVMSLTTAVVGFSDRSPLETETAGPGGR